MPAAVRREGVSIRGLAELRRAVRAMDRDLDKVVAKAWRETAKLVRDRARGFAPEKSGGLKRSIRHTVTMKRAAIFSDLVYAPIQEDGGRVGNGAVVPRAKAKRYMARAVDASRREIDASVEKVLDTLEAAWGE